MGKTLEALKRLTVRPAKPPADSPAPGSDESEPAALPATEEIPFIEVGGPLKAIEGSRDVMACPAPAARLLQPAAQPIPAATPELPAHNRVTGQCNSVPCRGRGLQRSAGRSAWPPN